jgi:heme-degrading monooxygenase HmoA
MEATLGSGTPDSGVITVIAIDPVRRGIDNFAGDFGMFIAMNRFRVARGSEEDFEHIWLSRDTYLDHVPGFMEFHLLKGPEAEDHTLYATHTVWESRAAFEAWTRSEAFRAAHHRAGEHKPLYLGHPQFEGFEIRQTIPSRTASEVSMAAQ